MNRLEECHRQATLRGPGELPPVSLGNSVRSRTAARTRSATNRRCAPIPKHREGDAAGRRGGKKRPNARLVVGPDSTATRFAALGGRRGPYKDARATM